MWAMFESWGNSDVDSKRDNKFVILWEKINSPGQSDSIMAR